MAEPLSHNVDVAVVGGGPAGLVTANAFADAGFETAIIAEKRDSTDQRTTALLDASVRMLGALGVWDAVAPHAAPLSVMRLIDDTGRLIRAPEAQFEAAEIGLDAFGFNVQNAPLTDALTMAVEARENVVWIDDLASNFDLGEDRAVISLAGGGTVSCHLVAAADGRKSPSRDAADITLRHWQYPQAAYVANFSHQVPHNSASTEFHTPTGPFTLVPLPGDRSSLVCVETPERAAELIEMPDDALNLEIERRAHSILGKMEKESPAQIYPLSSFVAKTFAARRVALIGEAAHGFPPIGAQGLNLSLRDIDTLVGIASEAHREGRDIGGGETLARYDSKRRPDVWSRTAGVDLLNRALLSEFLPAQLARSTGLLMANRIGPLRRLLMREGIAPRLGLRPLSPSPITDRTNEQI